MLSKNLREQLEQIRAAGHRGVWAGDLIDKTSTRELVRLGLADNGVRGEGGSSGLMRVYISQSGRSASEAPISAEAVNTSDNSALSSLREGG